MLNYLTGSFSISFFLFDCALNFGNVRDFFDLLYGSLPINILKVNGADNVEAS